MAREDEETRQFRLDAVFGRRSKERRQRSRQNLPTLTVLYHPDPERVGEYLELREVAAGRESSFSRLAPGFTHPGGEEHRPLADPYLSRRPLRFIPGAPPGSVRLIRGDSGTDVVADGEPVREWRDFPARQLEEGVVLELSGRVVLLLHLFAAEPEHEPRRLGLVGDSEAMLRVRQDILKVADLNVPVLLRGETGTGKELVARAIHQASPRRQRPCLTINLGAIPPALATSELFGSVKGAFTGAVRDQEGYFSRADGGTLFLDEVGEAPGEVQVMLLRVLETGEIQPVGGQRPQKVDVRLIAATDSDLEQAIHEGTFRAPLLHRLSGYEITIPPLRERRDDFGRLLFHFLREELEAIGEAHRLEPAGPPRKPWLPASIVARLARHRWPGNVRQLRNVARQLVIGSRGSDAVQVSPQLERMLRESTAPEVETREVPAASDAAPPPQAPPRPAYRKPSEISEEELLGALREHRWALKPTAEALNVSRTSLYALIDKCARIRKASDLSRQELEAALERSAGDLDAMVEELEVSKSGLQMRLTELGLEAG